MKLFLPSLALFSLLFACQGAQTPSIQATPNAAQKTSTARTIAVGASPHGLARAGNFVYNVNSSMGTLAVIDARNEQVVKVLTPPGGKASDIIAAPDGKHLVVINQLAGQLHIYAPEQDHTLLQSIDVGKSPEKLLFSADGSKAWVAVGGEAQLVECHFAKGLNQAPEITRRATGAIAASGTASRGLAMNNAWSAITNSGDNSISLFSHTGGEATTIKAGNNPNLLGFGGHGTTETLIIGNNASNTVTLYPLTSRQPVTLSDVGLSPTNIVVIEALERAFITMAGSNEVTVIDYRQGKVLSRISVGKRPVHIYAIETDFTTQDAGEDHTGLELWVGTDGESAVTVLDPTLMKVKATHSVGKGHHKMAFWHQKAFVSNINDNSVSVLDRNHPSP